MRQSRNLLDSEGSRENASRNDENLLGDLRNAMKGNLMPRNSTTNPKRQWADICLNQPNFEYKSRPHHILGLSANIPPRHPHDPIWYIPQSNRMNPLPSSTMNKGSRREASSKAWLNFGDNDINPKYYKNFCRRNNRDNVWTSNECRKVIFRSLNGALMHPEREENQLSLSAYEETMPKAACASKLTDSLAWKPEYIWNPALTNGEKVDIWRNMWELLRAYNESCHFRKRRLRRWGNIDPVGGARSCVVTSRSEERALMTPREASNIYGKLLVRQKTFDALTKRK